MKMYPFIYHTSNINTYGKIRKKCSDLEDELILDSTIYVIVLIEVNFALTTVLTAILYVVSFVHSISLTDTSKVEIK